MLRLMRRMLAALWSFVAARLRRYADRAQQNVNENLKADLFDERQRTKQLDATIAIRDFEIKLLTQRLQCEFEHKRTETEIEIAKRVINRPDREE
jgi:hypothetical protein